MGERGNFQEPDGMEYQQRFLPEEVLVDILGRLAPCSLAVSRGVCKAWRAIMDNHHLLRADLLPLSMGGIFISLIREPAPPEFFVLPSMAHPWVLQWPPPA
jgi:hypothetical protein